MKAKRELKTKVFFLLLLTIVSQGMSFAQPVSRETARQAAKTFLDNNGASSAELSDVSAAAGFDHLYVFTTDKSFVLMAADSRMQPVLGYSLNGGFDTEGMPENLRGWLQGYEEQIQAAIDDNVTADADIAKAWSDLKNGLYKSTTEVVVSPMLTTTWDQDYPYNYYCPAASGGPGGHVYAGCVATAMAQVMKYWNYPTTGQDSCSYVHSTYGRQFAYFGETTYDWANMPNAINNNSSQTYIDAIATLIYHCGVAVNMNYGTGGSGASSARVPAALIDYFRYAPSATYVSRDAFDDAHWIAFLKTELDDGRPLYYSGSNTNSGHAFVCDGYRSDNYFHFNWGWSGSDGSGHNNGYWLIGALNPGSGGSGSGSGTYNLNNAVLAWVEPISDLAAPVLSALSEGQSVVLSWESVAGAIAYDVFKDNAKVATVNTTGYTDTNLSFGDYPEYYVRATAGTTRSNPSNFFTIGFTYRNRIPQNLQAEVDNGNVTLGWDEVMSQSMYLHYGLGQAGGSYGSNTEEGTYWGQYYPAATIGNLYGMSIDAVSIYLSYAGTYTMMLYKGEVSDANNLMASIDFTGSKGWNEIVLEPVALEAGNDLWVVFHTSNSIQYPATYGFYEGEGEEHAHYLWYDFSQDIVYSMPQGISWPIKIQLNDAAFTYNVYCDNTLIAEQHPGVSYQDEGVAAGTHAYHVTAFENGWESEASDLVEVTLTPSLPTQTVTLNEGWTWWTPTVATTLAQLEAALDGNGILINSQGNGFARYEVVDGQGSWSGTLQGFVPGQMYRIETQTAGTITLTGETVPCDGFTFMPGYNWFGYTGRGGLSITEAIGFAPSEGDQIIGENGTATYNNSNGWSGDFTELVPGHGYIYFSTDNQTKMGTLQ